MFYNGGRVPTKNLKEEREMYRSPDAKRSFLPSDGPVPNPFIGFTSYQGFRSDPLFKDVTVVPENNKTETEATECYPVDALFRQDGEREGYYPDTTVAYIRLLWKDYEPRRGEYNDALIESVLKKAKENGQTVMLRLMPHSTRASDDVPDWLKALIPCPERPRGKRVKDSPADPVYLRYFGEAARAIAERFDSDPVLDVMDVSITGAWGEGYRCDDYPTEALEALIDVYTGSFKHTRLIGQVAAPHLIDYARRTVPCGWRGDGVGEAYHMNVKYPAAEERLRDVWKSAPVSFESFWWLCEWERLGWDIDEMIEKTLSWHVSTFNAKSFPIPEKWRGKVDTWIGRMGYHFSIREFEYPRKANPGDTLQFSLTVENTGVAPIYRAVPLRLKLKNGGSEYVFVTGADVRSWLPGTRTVAFGFPSPQGLEEGVYSVELSLAEEDGTAVKWENSGTLPDGSIEAGKIAFTRKQI